MVFGAILGASAAAAGVVAAGLADFDGLIGFVAATFAGLDDLAPLAGAFAAFEAGFAAAAFLAGFADFFAGLDEAFIADLAGLEALGRLAAALPDLDAPEPLVFFRAVAVDLGTRRPRCRGLGKPFGFCWCERNLESEQGARLDPPAG